MKTLIQLLPAAAPAVLGLAAFLSVGVPQAPAAIITGIVETGGDGAPTAQWTGNTFTGPAIGTYTVPVFGATAKCFADRVHAWTNASGTVLIPSYLLGQDYIMVRNDNRDNVNLRLNVTVASAVRVYLLIDNRLGDNANANPPTFSATNMQWVVDEAWTPVITGVNRAGNPAYADELGVDEGANGSIENYASIYSKTFPAGTFQLKQADNASRNMYGVVVVPIAPPAMPQNLTAVGADGLVNLTWSASGGATGYNLKRSTSQGGPYAPLATLSATNYQDLAVINDTPYYYVVSASNAAGESLDSAEATATPRSAPTGVTAVGGTGQVTVNWSALAGAASYTVRRSTASGGPYTAVATGIAGTSHVDNTVANGTTYYYVVIAQLTGGGDSGQSSEAAATTAPGTPTLTASVWAGTVARVAWSTPDPVVTSFLLELSTDGMTFNPLATVPGTLRAYTNTGLTLSSTYYYRLQAQNGTGMSAPSAVASVTLPAAAWNINFANVTAPVPSGYLQDTGEVYGVRDNGATYGWFTLGGTNVTLDARYRLSANSPDLRYDTFNHLMKSGPANPALSAWWEIEIPNGFYQTRIVAGDATAVDSVFQFTLEGVLTPTNIPVNGAWWCEFNTGVGVSDGRLTVNSGPQAMNNKICFIDIYPGTPVPAEIGTQPQSLMVEEYHAAALSVAVTNGSGPLVYQWYRNNTAVPGATSALYSLARATNAVHAGSYYVVITNYAGAVTSQVATLTINPDTTAPVLVSVASLDGVTIGLCFSDELDNGFDAVGDSANYTVTTTDGVQPVVALDVRPGGREVRLHLFLPSTGPFTVRADNLTDLAGNPCTANTASGTFGGFTSGDVGLPGLAGSHFACDTNAVEIVGGGADIWGAADQGRLLTRPLTGDFDARVRVLSLAGANTITRGVLLARETLDPGSAGLHVSINPPPPGRNQIELGVRTNTASLTGPWVAAGNSFTPANLPDAWLRLTRIGNVFTGFRSTNGVDWVAMGTNTRPYAASLQVGLGVTAHDNTLLATGRFSGLRLTSLTGAEPVNGTYNNGTFTASFPTMNGFTYTVEYRNSVNPGAWTPLATFVGDGTLKSFSDPGPVSPTQHRIYRVRYQ